MPRMPRTPAGAPLFLEEYPRLVDTLARVRASLLRVQIPSRTVMALFGSVARMTPTYDSDADVLVLFEGAT